MTAGASALSHAELVLRARALAGRTIGDLARALGLDLPADGTRTRKGVIGEIVEQSLLGARHYGSGPDVPALGIEIKTIPIARDGSVRESTFVATVAPAELLERDWSDTSVRAKLAHVVWFPIDAEVELRDRRIRSPVETVLNPELDRFFAEDWSELAELASGAGIDEVPATAGRALQLRPKAADGSVRVTASDIDGVPMLVGPRGAYLRARFTSSWLFGR